MSDSPSTWVTLLAMVSVLALPIAITAGLLYGAMIAIQRRQTPAPRNEPPPREGAPFAQER